MNGHQQESQSEQASCHVPELFEGPIPIQHLGTVAGGTAMPVVGCAEGIGLMQQANQVGMIVTAYDDAYVDRYSECKALKVEMGYQCMAPIFPRVSLFREYQCWTSALKHWLDTHYREPGNREPPAIAKAFPRQNLIIQRCRGSEAKHTFDVWIRLMLRGGFLDQYSHTSIKVETSRPKDELPFMVWTLQYNGKDTGCRIFFRGGWEPHRICHLPPPCVDDSFAHETWNTVFLLGTCCRFARCEEGDVLLPTVSIRYDCKQRVLSDKPEPLCNNWFEEFKGKIWSPKNQQISRRVISNGWLQGQVDICGADRDAFDREEWGACGDEFKFARGCEWIKPAVHIQLTDIFQVKSENETFTRATL